MHNTVVITVVVPTCFQIKFATRAFHIQPALHPFVSSRHEICPGGESAPGRRGQAVPSYTSLTSKTSRKTDQLGVQSCKEAAGANEDVLAGAGEPVLIPQRGAQASPDV